MFEPTPRQRAAIEADSSTLLVGPAGTGKSSALQQRLIQIIESGKPGTSVLVLVSEREHGQLFQFAIQQTQKPVVGHRITTFPGFAREMVSLFWPLVFRSAGFKEPLIPPTFLSYDLAQVLMWRLLTPLMKEGAFTGIRLKPQQIVSQLLDILNRSAMNGMSLEEANIRQVKSWAGPKEYIGYFHDAAKAVKEFRQHCQDRNLLDASLVHQVFDAYLLQNQEFQDYLQQRFQYFLVDNIEEYTPVGHRFVREMVDIATSCTLAIDSGGGYKRFLAADPEGANQFFPICRNVFRFEENFVSWPAMTHLSNLVNQQLQRTVGPHQLASEAISGTIHTRYRWDMVTELANYIQGLIKAEGLEPGDIAIITPYLDGNLRFSLARAMQKQKLPHYFLRRRSIPRDDPRVRSWLTWLTLAHPNWGIIPVSYDVAEALSMSIPVMDPARAQLVCEHLYRPDGRGLRSVDELSPDIRDRIGSQLVRLTEMLRIWLLENGQGKYPVDLFIERLYNELLATRSYQTETDLTAAAVCDWLVKTANNFRQAASQMGFASHAEQGAAFLEGISMGLVSANPPIIGDPPDPSGILISTIHAFLLSGHPVRYQVWLDAAATGWWDIPRQPLSNTFVLSSDWDPEEQWTMADDFAIRNELLGRIIQGLTNRCREGIILATSDLDRRGIQQEGPLWRALYPVRGGRIRDER